MFQKNEFRAAIVRRGIKNEELAKALGFNIATLQRKMNGTSDFYRSEIEQIRALLHLTQEDIMNIFFA